jgi:hypothetical protein
MNDLVILRLTQFRLGLLHEPVWLHEAVKWLLRRFSQYNYLVDKLMCCCIDQLLIRLLMGLI